MSFIKEKKRQMLLWLDEIELPSSLWKEMRALKWHVIQDDNATANHYKFGP